MDVLFKILVKEFLRKFIDICSVFLNVFWIIIYGIMYKIGKFEINFE